MSLFSFNFLLVNHHVLYKHLLLQINEKAVKKTGEVNAGFTDEKNTSDMKSGDATGQEPWMNNYVPYGKNPSGNPIDQVLPSSNIFNTLTVSYTHLTLPTKRIV